MTKKKLLKGVIASSLILIFFVLSLILLKTNPLGDIKVKNEENTNTTSEKRVEIDKEWDLYTNWPLGVQLMIPKKWFIRSAKDNVIATVEEREMKDVEYLPGEISLESSDKPLFWSSGKGPDDESKISYSGVAVRVTKSTFSDNTVETFFNREYGEGQWRSNPVKISDEIQGFEVSFLGGYQVYSREYYFTSGESIYHLGVRYENIEPTEIVDEIIKSIQLVS